MLILGIDWFGLVRQVYNESIGELWDKWSGQQIASFILGIFVWLIIGFVSFIIIGSLFVFIHSMLKKDSNKKRRIKNEQE